MRYKKNFLQQVIFQASYNRLDVLSSNISEDIKTAFEGIVKTRTKDTLVRNITFAEKENIVSQDVTVTHQWNFVGEEYKGMINQDMFQLTSLRYSHHDQFHGDIKSIYDKVKSVYNPTFTRISIRYVNNISLPSGGTFDFTNIINDSLLQGTLLFKDDGILRSLSSLFLRDDNGIQTKFSWGFVNRDFPNRVTRREFVLDYDCVFVIEDQSQEILVTLIKLKDKADYLFEKSILGGLRNLMNE